MGYNLHMRTVNPQALHTELTAYTARVWDALCEVRPALVRFNPPAIRLNNRLYRVAGMCYQQENIVDVATKFFLFSAEYAREMKRIIIPHEIIHQADYNLYGDSEKKCGHGVQWCQLMLDYGIPADKFHSMEIPRSFHIKKVK